MVKVSTRPFAGTWMQVPGEAAVTGSRPELVTTPVVSCHGTALQDRTRPGDAQNERAERTALHVSRTARALAGVYLAVAFHGVAPAQATGQSTPLFSLGGGIAFPREDASERHGAGFHFGTSGAFPLVGRLELELGAGYGRLGAKPGPVLADLEIDPTTFDLAGGFLDGGHRWTGSATLGARFLLLPRSSRVVPSVSAGAGWGGTGVADQRVWYLGRTETLEGFSLNSWASSVGATVDVHVRNGVGVFGAVRRVTVYTDPEPIRWVPLTFGISLRLEDR